MAKNFPLRIIDEKMYPKLEKAAKNKYMSVNAFINAALEESLKKSKKDFVISN